MIKAPSVTSLRVAKLAANFIHMKWDNVGGNFYYIVERRVVSSSAASDPIDNIYWEQLGTTSEIEWFDSNVIPLFTYQYRIRATYTSFEPSDWVESDQLKTFSTNAYVFTKMNDMTFSDKFLNEKFVKNNQSYIDFGKNEIRAGLMGEEFIYNSEIGHTSSVESSFVVDRERHEIQGDITGVCIDVERTFITEIDDVLYLFERYQPVIKVSNDKGQNWIYYQAFNGRVGNPVARQCTYQSDTTTFVIGYNEIFYGRPSTDLRWSEDVEKWSTTEYTFAKLGDENSVGFPVEIFGNYIDLPADLNMRAEAMSCSNNYLYVGGRGYTQRSDIANPVIDDQGKRTWEAQRDYITPDRDSRIVIKKLDNTDGRLYALVTGRVKLHPVSGNHLDPTKSENVEPSEYDGVYVYEDADRTWTRVFGNTEEERKHIDYTNTNMSTDGVNTMFTYDKYSADIIIDDNLPNKYPDSVTAAVAYNKEPLYSSDKQRHFISYRISTELLAPYRAPEAYHGESKFVWGFRGKTRSWINPSNRVVVAYPETKYEIIVDKEKNITKETWDRGEITINLDNIHFDGFSRYANGVLFYDAVGDIIGYYEFTYRVRDNVSIFWKPKNTLLTASLIQQTIEEEQIVKPQNGLVDPNLSPLLNIMAPEHYIKDDGMFRSFTDNYLQFLSTGESSYYNKLKNLIRNKYPKEANNFEYLYSEINRRNIYLDKEKREQVVRFFETRASDFYSTKGVVDSYKFLFKLLYNADVELEVESMNGLEYDVVVESGNITEDIVGTTVYTPTGRANVTYLEREYEDGKLRWRVTIHNLIGKFIAGQQLKSEVMSDVNALLLVGVRGKELAYNDIEYINRGRVYYTMKIKSELPLTRYHDDVVRFVHPVGFGFVGITLITVLINSGISFIHNETIINIMKAYRWDAGLPTVFPEKTYRRDSNNNIMFDAVTGEALKTNHPNAGVNPLTFPQWVNYDIDEATVGGLKPSARRVALSPTLDAGWVTYTYFSILEGNRLKDNIGLPRDPKVATQIKVKE